MVIALGHCHRLVAGEVVDLLDRDAEIEHSCDKGMAEIVGADVAKPSSLRWRQQLEAAYQQTAGAIAGLYEFAPDAGVEAELEAPAENGQPDLELVEA